MPQSFIKFYGNDWRSDPRLRLCQAESRGVWIDLISIMMEAEPFGHLLVNGNAPKPETIAALTVTPVKVIKRAIDDLEANGVFSRTEAGVIFSRRMIKDAARSAELSERGKRGGNPALVKPQLKPEVKPEALTHARSPEARSQKPEVNGHAAPKADEETAAEEIVTAFYAIRQHFYSIEAPDELPPREISIAKAWVEDGATFYPVRDVFERRMKQMAGQGKPAPSIWYLNSAIGESMKAGWPGFKP